MKPTKLYVESLESVRKIIVQLFDKCWHPDGFQLEIEGRPVCSKRKGKSRFEIKVYASTITRIAMDVEAPRASRTHKRLRE